MNRLPAPCFYVARVIAMNHLDAPFSDPAVLKLTH
jgi:hypothetical protein